MRVGSDNSLYSLLFAARKGAPAKSMETQNFSAAANPPKPTKSDEDLLAEFHDRRVQNHLSWSDTNHDGNIDKAEYVDGRVRLYNQNEQPVDMEAIERDWNAIDIHGKGTLNESDLREGLVKFLPVSIGHLSQPLKPRG